MGRNADESVMVGDIDVGPVSVPSASTDISSENQLARVSSCLLN